MNFENKLEMLLGKFKNMKKGRLQVLLLEVTATFFIVLFVSLLVVGRLIQIFKNGAYDRYSVLSIGLSDGFMTSFFIACLATAFVSWAIFNVGKRNMTFQYDEDTNVYYMTNGTSGTSRWMQKPEIMQAFQVSSVPDTTDFIYGQLTSNGEQVVSYKAKYSNDGTGLQNHIIVGPPESGKSYVVCRTEYIQTIRRGDSFAGTDPSFEMYMSISQLARDNGYKIFALNLADPEYSDCWNCLEETINPNTGRLDGNRLGTFSETFMANVSTGKEDAFWASSAINLLSAGIGLVAFNHEKFVIDRYRELFNKIASQDPKCLSISSQMHAEAPNEGDVWTGHVGIIWCEKQILSMANKYGYDINEIIGCMDRIKSDTEHVFTMEKVYDTMMHFKDHEKEFDIIPERNAAKHAYNIYNSSESMTVRTQALQGLLNKFQLFVDGNVLSLLSHDGIHLNQFNLEKTGCFVITDDTSNLLKPISSLFFTFLFKDVQQVYKKKSQEYESKDLPNPCLGVSVLLDEFFSVGVIGGNPDDFTTVMSNSRKYKVHTQLIVQGIKQINQLYGDENASTIQADAPNLVILGCGDDDTAKWVSDRCGTATVMQESHKVMDSLVSTQSSNEMSMGATSRKLMTPDEAMRLGNSNKVLVIKNACLPVKLNTFPWKEHYLYKSGKITKSNIYELIEPISERFDNIDDFFNMGGSNESFDEWFLDKLKTLKPDEELKWKNKKAPQFVKEEDLYKPGGDDFVDVFAGNDVVPSDVDSATEDDDWDIFFSDKNNVEYNNSSNGGTGYEMWFDDVSQGNDTDDSKMIDVEFTEKSQEKQGDEPKEEKPAKPKQPKDMSKFQVDDARIKKGRGSARSSKTSSKKNDGSRKPLI